MRLMHLTFVVVATLVALNTYSAAVRKPKEWSAEQCVVRGRVYQPNATIIDGRWWYRCKNQHKFGPEGCMSLGKMYQFGDEFTEAKSRYLCRKRNNRACRKMIGCFYCGKAVQFGENIDEYLRLGDAGAVYSRHTCDKATETFKALGCVVKKGETDVVVHQVGTKFHLENMVIRRGWAIRVNGTCTASAGSVYLRTWLHECDCTRWGKLVRSGASRKCDDIIWDCYRLTSSTRP